MAEKRTTQYHHNFQQELNRLNEQQRVAVEQIEGPVLVVAGPGTGKTHILSARIGRILTETDTQPFNILCLTFTDAGANAMRERLLQFIGPAAHNVHIYTFHSFCNKVIQENLELFGIQKLEPLSDLERVEFIRKMIDVLPLDHPLKRGRRDIYFYEKHLHNLFQMMKKENWKEAFIHQNIKTYLADLPKRADYIYQRKAGRYEKGDVKEGKLQKETEKMERLWAAASLFDDYVRLLQSNRRYDYEDMLLWVIREFGRFEKLLRFYQEQYLYLLVDEYQDTSGAQNKILQQLIAYWANPNVFIVGDDDQSIYEFQGARLKNLVDFHQQYEAHLKVVFLKNNYRSSQAILDVAKVLIDKNQKRISRALKVDKNIVAQHPQFLKTKVKPEVIAYPNRMQEETAIMTAIQQLHQKGILYEEIAVIYARHRQARNLIELLEKQGIPYQTKRKVNILDLPMIENLRFLLEYINLEYKRIYNGEHLLFQILHFNFLEIPHADLLKISRYLAGNYEAKWRDTISDEKLLNSLDLTTVARILNFSNLLNQTINDYRNVSLSLLIERLVNRSGLLKHILSQTNQAWGLQVLSTLMNFIRIEVDRKPRMRLDGLLEVLGKMDANYLTVGVQKTEQAWAGVNFVTAHSSKGLEYRAVFILDAVKDYWEPGKVAPYQFSLPDTITYSGEEDAMEARRRLFYVAITRAMEYLTISYAQTNNNGKILRRTQFLDEILATYPIQIQEKTVSQAALLGAYETILSESKEPQIEPIQKAVVDELLVDFKLSISSLNAYLRCPLSFYYEKVLQVPSVTSEAAAYGLAIHHALMVLIEKMKRSETKKYPAQKSLLGYFNQEMKRQKGYFTTKEYERRLALGRANLNRIYTHFLPNWSKNTLVEHPIKNTAFRGVPLTGVIDKIELTKEEAHVVDYKTGSHNPTKLARPSNAKPYGGTYWRQLVFYKLLYEANRPTAQKVNSGEIFYVDPDPSGQLASKKITISEDEAELIGDLVVTTYQKILAHDFYEGCGESHCTWCNFVRKNVLVDSFVDVELDELDDI